MMPAKKPPVPRLKILLDTNVIISALHFGGNPLEILNLARAGDVELWLSLFILEETRQVLLEKLHWETGKIQSAITYLESLAKIVHPKTNLNLIQKKEADNRILEAAVDAKVEFLVSGDTRHIQPLKKYKGIKMVSPAEFLWQMSNLKI
jgi:putative PIN family toxin of toxin-antitoxin system